MFAAKNELLTRPNGGYNLTRSLRFRSSASAYLSRTPATASNRKTWTWSFWFKRGKLGANQFLLDTRPALNDNQLTGIYINTSDVLLMGGYATDWRITTQVFRDPAAWYHLVVVLDTTQATATNRIKMYINGVQITSFSTSNDPALNADLGINQASLTGIGSLSSGASFFDGYMAEMNFIDGQALTPSSFGAFSIYNQWLPKKYAGTYGTNGFYLPFTNNASAATLGNDFSGNSNTWTTNNISVTTGSSYDSTTDVPTLTSATAANYCTGNWLNQSDLDILRNGNLYWRTDNERVVTGTFAMSSGKWYWEATVDAIVSFLEIGIVGTQVSFSAANNTAPGTYSSGFAYRSNATKINNNSATSYGASFTSGNVIGIAFDSDAGTITFYKNGSTQGTAFTGIPSAFYVPCSFGGIGGGNTSAFFNFGQQPFVYTPPTGYLALNTFNL